MLLCCYLFYFIFIIIFPGTMKLLLFATFSAVAAANRYTTAADADEIQALPGWEEPLPSRQYSGYLDVTSTKHIHYWLVL